MQAKSVGGGIPDALTKDLNFATYKAVAMACDNGATLPTSPAPVVGQWFLHTPTGRKVLMQYDGSNWIPIYAYGVMTIYVDKTDGTDSQNGGTGVDAAAFKTIQFAINQIPPLYSGNITVNINGESYAEAVVIGGKNPTGAYTITINGTLSSQETLTGATCVAGLYNSRGTITKAGEFSGNNYANMLAYFVTDNKYRIIDGHATTLPYTSGKTLAPVAGNILTGNTSGAYCTVISCSITSGSFAGNNAAGNLVVLVEYGTFQNAETFTNVTTSNADNATCGTPATNNDTIVYVGGLASVTASQNVIIYDWSTITTGFEIAPAQKGIIFYNIKVDYIYGQMTSDIKVYQTYLASGGETINTNLGVLSIYGDTSSQIYIYDSVLVPTTCLRPLRCGVGAFLNAQRCKATKSGANVNISNGQNGCIYPSCCVLDGLTKSSGSIGLYATEIALGYLYIAAGPVCNIIRNVATGIKADTNSALLYTTENTYVIYINVTTKTETASGGQIP